MESRKCRKPLDHILEKKQAYLSARTVVLSILTMHTNWAFPVHNDKHIDRVLYYYLFNIGQRDLYVCLFLYLVHLLYHEVGLKYECCWSFLVTLTVCGVTFYLGKQLAQVSSLRQRRYFPKEKSTPRDPRRQPDGLISLFFFFYLNNSGWFLYATYFNSEKVASACGAILNSTFWEFYETML